MKGRTSAPYTKNQCQQVILLAFVAVKTGKAFAQVAAVKVLVNDLLDRRLQKAVFLFVLPWIRLYEIVEMPAETFPQRRCLRLPGTIDLIHHAADCIKGPVPSNGTGREIMKTKSRPQYYRIRRVLEMVREGTQSGYLANSSDFKNELGVSRRTVARDLDFLRDEENAPIEYDESGKGYRLTDG